MQTYPFCSSLQSEAPVRKYVGQNTTALVHTHKLGNDVTVSLTIFGHLPMLFSLVGRGHRSSALLS